MTTARTRTAYFNGRFVPEPEILVPFRDRGFKFGDAVFDTARTFGHRIFKVREHIDRLYYRPRFGVPGLHLEIRRDHVQIIVRLDAGGQGFWRSASDRGRYDTNSAAVERCPLTERKRREGHSLRSEPPARLVPGPE